MSQSITFWNLNHADVARINKGMQKGHHKTHKLELVKASNIYYLNFLSTEVADLSIIFRNDRPGTFESNLLCN